MSRPWMPLYVSDYLGDTRRLTTLEHGAYLLLIMEYWQHGGLPEDEAELADIAGLDAEGWQTVRTRIARLFIQPGWKHKRIEEELAKASEISERRKASAERRWSKRDANALQEDVTSNARAGVPQPQPHISNLKVACPKQVRTRKAYSEAFEAFWTDYPTDNLMSKSEAGKAWDRLTGEDQALVQASLPAFKAYCAQHSDYRPIHACRYLSQRRFDGFGKFVREQQASGKVWIKVGTSAFNAWNTWYQDTYGRSAPRSDKGGWYFPAEFPPSNSKQAGAAA